MNIKEKIKKIKKRCLKSANGEKTGVLNGLVVLGALAGVIAVSSETSAVPTCDATSHEITDTNLNSLPATGDGIDTSSWDNHCWWDHSWYDHSWWDHSWYDHSWWDWSDWYNWADGSW